MSDADVPIEWSRATRDALVKTGKQVELVEYSGQPHEIYHFPYRFYEKNHGVI